MGIEEEKVAEGITQDVFIWGDVVNLKYMPEGIDLYFKDGRIRRYRRLIKGATLEFAWHGLTNSVARNIHDVVIAYDPRGMEVWETME